MSELVVWKPDHGELIPQGGQRVTSLDLTTVEGQRMAYLCHVGTDKRLKEYVGTPIRVTDFYAHYVMRVDETTGEEKPGPRCILILDDGTRVATSSETAIKCMEAWATVSWRTPPWNPPLEFVPRLARGAKGEYLWLDLPECKPIPLKRQGK